jgi:PilZ domain-containing protein
VNDRRGAPRYGVEVEGIIQPDKGDEDRVTISNLSCDGCRLSAPGRRFPIGTVLTLTVGPIGIVRARVTRRAGASHGVSFDQPLSSAELDHIRLFLSKEPALIEEPAT